MSKKVVFIADDLGLSPEINGAIFYAHREGGLTGASLMMAQPATADAVHRAAQHPGLHIGWHLHLCDSTPATVTKWPWGNSPARAGWALGWSPGTRALARQEISRQWELFQATGLECRFINSHHHLHAHPYVYRCLREIIGTRFNGWIRLGRARTFGPAPLRKFLFAAGDLVQKRRRRLSAWRTTDTLWGLDRLFHMNAHEIREMVKRLPPGFHEFLFHPRSPTCLDTLCLLQLKSLSSP